MQASVVAGFMACCGMSWAFAVAQGLEHLMSCDEQLRRTLNERFSVCEEQTRTCATAQRPECQQARAPR